jgi:hypothetical protein
MNDSSLLAGYADRTYPTMIDARCKENALARYLGCPAQYFLAPRRAVASTGSSSPDAVIAPSFDCSRARFADERTICATPELARLDNLDTRAYSEVRSIPNSRNSALERNKLILQSRRDCRDDIECIKNVQRKALQIFRSLGATVSE